MANATVPKADVATLPTEELVFDISYRDELEAFAGRIGRPDRSLTVDEYIRFLEARGERHDPARIRQWFGDLAAAFATYPTGREGWRRAFVAHLEELLDECEARP